MVLKSSLVRVWRRISWRISVGRLRKAIGFLAESIVGLVEDAILGVAEESCVKISVSWVDYLAM